MIVGRHYWVRRAALAVAVLAALCTALCGVRSYRTYLLLSSAYEVGMPKASTVRAWMTLRYIASAYRVPEARLLTKLGLPPATPPNSSLRSLADREGMSPFHYVQRVQQAIAEVAGPSGVPAQAPASPGWLDRFNDQILSALLSYGYAVLGLTLLFGAIGFPVPTGIAAIVVGSLAAAGRMDWAAAGAIAVAASLLGDVVAYGLGRGASEQFMARRGRWFGYTVERHAHARALFERWGGLTVLITRTLVSHLSSVVSVLAGISHYRLASFLSVAFIGRMMWTATYMGIGYGIGSNIDAATGFLTNLSLLLLSVSVLAGSALIVAGRIKFGRHAIA